MAEAVIESVLEISSKEGFKRVKEINISLGELQDIEEEIFEFALKNMMRRSDIIRNSQINIKIEKTVFRCRACGHVWNLSDIKGIDRSIRESMHFLPEVSHSFIRCPKCGSPDFEIKKGRGVSIESISGEKDGSEDQCYRG